MVDTSTMEFRFAGSVQPTTVPAGDVAQIIKAAEEAVLSIVEEELLDPERVEVHFVHILPGSLNLGFTSRRPAARTAFYVLADRVQRSNYDRLAAKAVAGLQLMHKYSRAWNCPLELWAPQESDKPLATLVPAAEIRLPPRIAGPTTIYGEVIRVGGQRPRIRMRLLDDTEISCTAPKSLVQRLGARLYQVVGLEGQAQWETDRYTLVSFQADAIVDYDDTADVGTTLDELSRRFGKYFNDIRDVDAYVRSLREDDADSEEVAPRKAPVP
jgi:hypothetical protein